MPVNSIRWTSCTTANSHGAHETRAADPSRIATHSTSRHGEDPGLTAPRGGRLEHGELRLDAVASPVSVPLSGTAEKFCADPHDIALAHQANVIDAKETDRCGSPSLRPLPGLQWVTAVNTGSVGDGDGSHVLRPTSVSSSGSLLHHIGGNRGSCGNSPLFTNFTSLDTLCDKDVEAFASDPAPASHLVHRDALVCEPTQVYASSVTLDGNAATEPSFPLGFVDGVGAGCHRSDSPSSSGSSVSIDGAGATMRRCTSSVPTPTLSPYGRALASTPPPASMTAGGQDDLLPAGQPPPPPPDKPQAPTNPSLRCPRAEVVAAAKERLLNTLLEAVSAAPTATATATVAPGRVSCVGPTTSSSSTSPCPSLQRPPSASPPEVHTTTCGNAPAPGSAAPAVGSYYSLYHALNSAQGSSDTAALSVAMAALGGELTDLQEHPSVPEEESGLGCAEGLHGGHPAECTETTPATATGGAALGVDLLELHSFLSELDRTEIACVASNAPADEVCHSTLATHPAVIIPALPQETDEESPTGPAIVLSKHAVRSRVASQNSSFGAPPPPSTQLSSQSTAAAAATVAPHNNTNADIGLGTTDRFGNPFTSLSTLLAQMPLTPQEEEVIKKAEATALRRPSIGGSQGCGSSQHSFTSSEGPASTASGGVRSSSRHRNIAHHRHPSLTVSAENCVSRPYMLSRCRTELVKECDEGAHTHSHDSATCGSARSTTHCYNRSSCSAAAMGLDDVLSDCHFLSVADVVAAIADTSDQDLQLARAHVAATQRHPPLDSKENSSVTVGAQNPASGADHEAGYGSSITSALANGPVSPSSSSIGGAGGNQSHSQVHLATQPSPMSASDALALAAAMTEVSLHTESLASPTRHTESSCFGTLGAMAVSTVEGSEVGSDGAVLSTPQSLSPQQLCSGHAQPHLSTPQSGVALAAPSTSASAPAVKPVSPQRRGRRSLSPSPLLIPRMGRKISSQPDLVNALLFPQQRPPPPPSGTAFVRHSSFASNCTTASSTSLKATMHYFDRIDGNESVSTEVQLLQLLPSSPTSSTMLTTASCSPATGNGAGGVGHTQTFPYVPPAASPQSPESEAKALSTSSPALPQHQEQEQQQEEMPSAPVVSTENAATEEADTAEPTVPCEQSPSSISDYDPLEHKICCLSYNEGCANLGDDEGPGDETSPPHDSGEGNADATKSVAVARTAQRRPCQPAFPSSPSAVTSLLSRERAAPHSLWMGLPRLTPCTLDQDLPTARPALHRSVPTSSASSLDGATLLSCERARGDVSLSSASHGPSTHSGGDASEGQTPLGSHVQVHHYYHDAQRPLGSRYHALPHEQPLQEQNQLRQRRRRSQSGFNAITLCSPPRGLTTQSCVVPGGFAATAACSPTRRKTPVFVLVTPPPPPPPTTARSALASEGSSGAVRPASAPTLGCAGALSSSSCFPDAPGSGAGDGGVALCNHVMVCAAIDDELDKPTDLVKWAREHGKLTAYLRPSTETEVTT